MSIKTLALIALAGTALATPAFAADIDQLMKEINALKAQVNALSKKQMTNAPSASSVPTFNYVKTCEAQGDGFFVIPGTSSCLRLSGYARADVKGYQANDTATNSDKKNRLTDYGTRFRLNTDFRSSTDMGTLRGFTRINLDLTQTAAGSAGLAGNARVGYAYVTLGGWSAGIQDTAFMFFGAPGEVGLITTDDAAATLAASYTASFGSGISGTLSVENPYVRQNNPTKYADGTTPGANVGAGVTQMPDVVGALQMVQGPATFKLSGAAHQNVSVSDTERGYAVQGGLKYVVSPETTLVVQGTYANAALAYLGYSRGSGYSSGVLGVGLTPDYEISSANDSITETSKGWSALANIQQKLGSGVVWLTGVYGVVNDNALNANVEAKISQAELSYVFKPYAGLNIQPAVSVQKIDNSTGADYSQSKGMLRVWREF